MTKDEENKLKNRVSRLEKQVIELYQMLENNILNKSSYSVLEVAKILEVTTKTVYNMIERGELDAVKLGHVRIIGASLRKKLGVID